MIHDVKYTRLKSSKAFTLMELLVVIAIMAIVSGIGAMAMRGLDGGSAFTATGQEMASLFQEARSYAMANNTHVFLGMIEVDAKATTTHYPILAASGSNGGRIFAAMAASKDGSQGYDINNPGPLQSDLLIPVGKVRKYEKVHMIDLSSTPTPTQGGMARRKVTNPKFHLGSNSALSKTPFSWPIGGAQKQFTFNRVIQFDPQGTGYIVVSANGNFTDCFEIGLQKIKGNVIPAISSQSSPGDIMAIQIDGITGSVQIYRP